MQRIREQERERRDRLTDEVTHSLDGPKKVAPLYKQNSERDEKMAIRGLEERKRMLQLKREMAFISPGSHSEAIHSHMRAYKERKQVIEEEKSQQRESERQAMRKRYRELECKPKPAEPPSSTQIQNSTFGKFYKEQSRQERAKEVVEKVNTYKR